MKEKIIIGEININVKTSDVFNEDTLRNDIILINEIKEYSNKIIKNGGEIFKQEKNIIATSEGYFLAFYESDLEKT